MLIAFSLLALFLGVVTLVMELMTKRPSQVWRRWFMFSVLGLVANWLQRYLSDREGDQRLDRMERKIDRLASSIEPQQVSIRGHTHYLILVDTIVPGEHVAMAIF